MNISTLRAYVLHLEHPDTTKTVVFVSSQDCTQSVFDCIVRSAMRRWVESRACFEVAVRHGFAHYVGACYTGRALTDDAALDGIAAEMAADGFSLVRLGAEVVLDALGGGSYFHAPLLSHLSPVFMDDDRAKHFGGAPHPLARVCT
jgi:hypothetical protein